MSRRTMLFCAFAVGAAGLFMRLGFWQLGRLGERQARNASVAAQLGGVPVPLSSLPRDTGQARYRTATVAGRLDYDHEIVVSGRTRQGSPGVELLTPMRVAGTDTAVLVNRGWVYSPNASTVDRARWHEGDSAAMTGYVALYAPDAGVTASPSDPRVVRRASRSELAPRIPYPLAPYYLVATGGVDTSGHPGRHEPPALVEGSHRSYAFQWFAFAAIALVGAGSVVARERRERRER
jgi:surfeit locus 1 family protein